MAYGKEWAVDMDLKCDLQKYVNQNLRRSEIVDFVKRDYPSYFWSLPTLDRRLRYFEIYYIDHTTSLQQVSGAVEKELEGPGKLIDSFLSNICSSFTRT